jgi:putative heme-binding domain-containing protein
VAKAPADPEPGLPNPEGSLLTKGKAARIFSCRPDGSDVRVLCGGGMDNPVEVDFFETGECLGSVNLFYNGPRGDCLVHWIEGGVFPRYDQQDSVAEFKSTGDLLTEVHNYGHVAVSGMTRYRSGPLFSHAESLPDSAEFLVTQFNTHKVVHTVIQRDGATFRHVATRDLLISPDPDCHPTDVMEDADGSLLVIDTGGWFRIGCPTSQIAKPEITGAIYRIRKAGTTYAPRTTLLAALPSGNKNAASPSALISDLQEAEGPLREVVADRIVLAAEQQPGEVYQQFAQLDWAGSEPLERSSLWTLSRLGASGSPGVLLTTLHTSSQVATRLVALQGLLQSDLLPPERAAFLEQLAALTQHESPALRRAAVTAIAQVHLNGEQAAGVVIESLRGLQPERMMEHAATYALIRIAGRDATAAALSDPNPQIRRAALIALDQMEGGDLRRDQVIPLLDTDDATLQKAVLEVIARHDGWASEALALVKEWMTDPQTDDSRQAVLRGFLIARAAEPEVQQLVAESLANSEVSAPARLALLEVMSRAAVETWPAVWNDSLRGALAQSDEDLRLQALRVVASRNLDAFDTELATLADSMSEDARLRCEAFVAIAPRVPEISDDLLRFLSRQLADAEVPVIDKLRIVTGLTQAKLSESQLADMSRLVSAVGPAVAPALLSIYARPGSEQLGLVLVAQLQAAADGSSLPAGELRRVLANYPAAVLAAAAPLMSVLDKDAAVKAARLDELAATISGGSAEHGRELFNGKQAACSSCHRVNGAGALVGPDLSKISAIRQPRDLLESILYPSASFARGYEPYTVLLADGRIVSGIIARETAHDLVLRTNDLSEVRMARSAIDEMQPSQTSIMPQGLDGRMTQDELRDLVAYLQSLK